MEAAHPGNGIRRCGLCMQSFANVDADKIDLIHYQSHDLSIYHCIFCSKYESDIQQMQQHLSDCHSNKLPYVMQRILNDDVVDDDPKIYRLQLLLDDDLFVCSPLSEMQINYKSPLLGAHLISNANAMPNDEGIPLVNYADFMLAYTENMKKIDNAEQLYRFEILPLFQPANSDGLDEMNG